MTSLLLAVSFSGNSSSICAMDTGANNGGCTEPHVSHGLSSRLSSRPMAWSKTTLQKLAPVLAVGKVSSVSKPNTDTVKRLPQAQSQTVLFPLIISLVISILFFSYPFKTAKSLFFLPIQNSEEPIIFGRFFVRKPYIFLTPSDSYTKLTPESS